MKTAITAILILFGAHSAANAVYVLASCEGDSVRLQVGVPGAYENPTGHEIIVQADLVGVCDEPFTVTTSPLPYPEWLDFVVYEIVVVAPAADQYAFYRAWHSDASGTLSDPGSAGDLLQYDVEGCGEAPIARGRITRWTENGDIFVYACADECWISDFRLDFSEASPGSEQFINSGTIVTIFGDAIIDGMPGGTHFAVSHVVEDPSGEDCGIVDTDSQSWGSLKSLYR